MLNSFSRSSQEVNISAVSGTICKTHKKSFIYRFQIGSDAAKNVLTFPPQMNFNQNDYFHFEDVVVLQVMNSNDTYVICEIVKKSDFDDMQEAKP